MANTKKLALSRRQILAGLGAVGVGGAAAGVGTTALFSDEESFDGNGITAGELDLTLRYETTYNSGDSGATNQVASTGTVNGDPAILFDLNDVKPGDSGAARICFSIVDNPAWIWLQTGVATDAENGVNEPEADAAGENDPRGSNSGTSQSGELAEALNSTWWYESDGDLKRDAGEPTITGDLFDDDFNAGVQLDGDPNTSGADAFSGSGTASYDHCIAFSWELPASVGNEVQSDSVTFPVRLFAEQERNNPSPDNPVANIQI